MSKSVKMADIASIVGVSTVTVSKALSGQKGVSEEMREKIQTLADEMGYRPPSASRQHDGDKHYNIGVVVLEGYVEQNVSFYWQMYQELNKKLLGRGSFTLLELVAAEDNTNGVLPRLAQEKRVDGIVVIGRMSDAYIDNLDSNAGVPVVYMDYYDEQRCLDTVISNGYYGTYALTDYLYNMGHRDIAFVGTVRATDSITDRFTGYLRSLIEHELPYKQEWIIDDRHPGSNEVDPDNLLILPKKMPTAFVCNCDVTAGFLINKLRDAGYRVPDDISVVGFDNYIYPGTCDIGITTYEVDIAQMCTRTAHKIVRKIAGEKYTSGVFIVDGSLVVKDSVKKIG